MSKRLIECVSDTPAISVVIPVFRSEMTLPILIKRLDAVLRKVSSNFEVVLVNDGSPDRSWEVISDLVDRYNWIRAIDLMRNFGQHNALLCGIRSAQFEIIITMDDDLQHPPEEIPKLLTALAESNYDVVYGKTKLEQHGFMRNLATTATKLVLRTVMDARTVRDVSSFRVFRSEVARAFRSYESPFVSIDVLLTWGTSRFGSVNVRHERRREGASGYTIRKLASHTMNLVTGVTAIPLRMASVIGVFLSFVGFGVLSNVLIRYFLEGDVVPGFPFLASIVALFSGAQLFAIGVIGEYLARMHFRSLQKPTYVIRRDSADLECDASIKGSS